jgi:hypothetical protein
VTSLTAHTENTDAAGAKEGKRNSRSKKRVQSNARFLPLPSSLFPLTFALCSLFFAIWLTTCENSLVPGEKTAGAVTQNNNNNNNNNGDGDEDIWDPVIVIALRTTAGKPAVLSFMPVATPGGASSARGTFAFGESETETYNYRLHLTGGVFSKGTVTVSKDGTTITLEFISDGEIEFTGSIEIEIFSFDYGGFVHADTGETVNFQTAVVPPVNETVTPANSISLTFNGEAVASAPFILDVDITANLAAQIEPEGADTQVWWSTDAPDILQIVPAGLNATVTALKGGSAVIKVKTVAGGKIKTCAVTARNNVAGIYDADGNIIENLNSVSGTAVLTSAFTWIKNNGTTDGVYTIFLKEDENDITATGYTIGTGEGANGSTGNSKQNLKITLKGANKNTTITKTVQGSLFTVYGTNAQDMPELILGENITLKGYNNNNKALVVIGSATNSETKTGKLTMNNGSLITENDNKENAATTNGGGVYVYASSEFAMNGGTISNNTVTTAANAGGGVFSNGTFTMSGSSAIKDNKATGSGITQGGGVVAGSLGGFTMKGGTISGNVAHNTGTTNVAYVGVGGGVAAKTFTMEGGTIENNTAEMGGGIGTLNVASAVIKISGSSSIIKNNHADAEKGCAIDLLKEDATLIIDGGTVYGTAAAAGLANKSESGISYAIARRDKITNGGVVKHYCNDTVTALSVTTETGMITLGEGWSTP